MKPSKRFKINYCLSDFGLERIIEKNDSILLAEENSMIDTAKIDIIDNGKVAPQAVNLSNMTGNNYVLSLIDEMKKGRGIYFPGTLLEDLGDYYLPTMPIICNGDIIGKRRKLSAFPIVDDYLKLAARLLGEEYGKKFKNSSVAFYSGPMSKLQEKLKKVSNKAKFEGEFSFEYKGNIILPIICNEFSDIAERYKGKRADLILHSAECMYRNDEERIESYSSYMKKMKSKGMLKDPCYIAFCEQGDGNEFSSACGKYIFKSEKLKKVA